jgi:hypothetical protein
MLSTGRLNMVYRRNTVAFLLSAFLFLSLPLFARGNSESRSRSTAEHSGLDVPGIYGREENPPPENPAEGNVPESVSRGEQVMKALAAAYPEAIGSAEYRDGDWAVKLRGVWYYYAGGRLLAEEFRSRSAEYDPQPFYNYLAELPPWREPGREDAERFRSMARSRRNSPGKRAQFFFDDLWRAHDRAESYERVKSLRFLGHSVLVHYSILEELSLVEERIREEAKTSAEVRRWISSLETLTGWNWRTIADTQSRSFHAYGAAIDLLPRSLGGLETYWLWAAERSPEWWAVPYSRRFHPPEAVIKAFEAYGFVWGGKWLFYDTMHFEYRPEIFILNGIPLTGPR